MPLLPLFLISLPRSGSTWLQRMLGSLSTVVTVDEPWFLLAPLALGDKRVVEAKYDHKIWLKAIENLRRDGIEFWPLWRTTLANLAMHIYGEIAKKRKASAQFFLDKTPRYYWVLDELAAVFPDARFIVLIRNPLESALSMERTWRRVPWRSDTLIRDFVVGIPRISRFVEQCPAEKCLVVYYDELIQDSAREMRRIADWLGVPFEVGCVRTNQSGVRQDLFGDSVSKEMAARPRPLDGDRAAGGAFEGYIAAFWMKRIERISQGTIFDRGWSLTSESLERRLTWRGVKNDIESVVHMVTTGVKQIRRIKTVA